ncbi:MAG: hypothetical protein JRJ59_11205 [Deltaproteobacteria bacterium]|nr:hypothetical protein [Deltaproteobacteria bacterium]
MRKWLKAGLLVLAAAALAGLAAVWLQKGGLRAVVWQEKARFNTGQLMGSSAVGQTFVCPRDNLALIEVRMGTYGSWSASPFSFRLVELDRLPPGRPARFGPSAGRPLTLRPGMDLIQLLDVRREDFNGLECLVCRGPEPAPGRLALTVSPLDQGSEAWSLRLTKPLNDLPEYGFSRFEFPLLTVAPGQTLKVVLSLEGAGPGGCLVLYWLKYPPPTSLKRMERATSRQAGFEQRFRGGAKVLPGELVLRLSHPPSLPLEPVRAAKELNSWAVSDNSFCPVSFGPLPDSKGKAFFFYLTAPQASRDQALTLWADREAPPDSRLVRDGVVVDGSLAFRASCAVSKGEVLKLFADRLAAGQTLAGWGWWLAWAAGLVQAGAAVWLIFFLLRLNKGGLPGKQD